MKRHGRGFRQAEREGDKEWMPPERNNDDLLLNVNDMEGFFAGAEREDYDDEEENINRI